MLISVTDDHILFGDQTEKLGYGVKSLVLFDFGKRWALLVPFLEIGLPVCEGELGEIGEIARDYQTIDF